MFIILGWRCFFANIIILGASWVILVLVQCKVDLSTWRGLSQTQPSEGILVPNLPPQREERCMKVKSETTWLHQVTLWGETLTLGLFSWIQSQHGPLKRFDCRSEMLKDCKRKYRLLAHHISNHLSFYSIALLTYPGQYLIQAEHSLSKEFPI